MKRSDCMRKIISESEMIVNQETKKDEHIVIKYGMQKEKIALSIKLSASNKYSDDGWLLFFKAGKLVRVDYWIAC